ncbi:hypothetical protein NBRC10513_002483 [Rhodotorula toruloides]
MTDDARSHQNLASPSTSLSPKRQSKVFLLRPSKPSFAPLHTTLEKLIPYLGRSCCRSSIHPDALPHLQASDAGCVIGKLTSSSADQPYIVYLLFGETDFMPLFLLPIDSDFTLAYPSPEREVRDDSAASTSLSHVGISASQVVETLVSLFPNKPDNPPSESRLPERKSAILLFGKRTPYDASLVSHGTSLPPLFRYRHEHRSEGGAADPGASTREDAGDRGY